MVNQSFVPESKDQGQNGKQKKKTHAQVKEVKRPGSHHQQQGADKTDPKTIKEHNREGTGTVHHVGAHPIGQQGPKNKNQELKNNTVLLMQDRNSSKLKIQGQVKTDQSYQNIHKGQKAIYNACFFRSEERRV